MGHAGTIQIIGRKSCADTRKAIRFFRERGLSPHFLDLQEKRLSRGELENIARALGAETLVDTGSAAFERGGYRYREYDPLEELLENQGLVRTPIGRNGSAAVIGNDAPGWAGLIRKDTV
jgi:arsenate reductase-like glutaredoxin family protein